MIYSDKELLQYIYDDVQKYEGFQHFVKAGFLERLFVAKQRPEMLHPNPYDEFSMPSVGPNFGIISEYCTLYVDPSRLAGEDGEKRRLEPLMVEKMAREGYMILNGHHRWAAAMKMGIKKVPINIVNLTHEEDHIRMMEKSSNVKRVIFDFDEVLCATEAHPRTEETPRVPFGLFEKKFTERLRWGVPVLLQELRNMGYDVWVYTSTFNSVRYIRWFFRMYGVKVDGVINGAGRKKTHADEQKHKDMIRKKYELIYHVGAEGVQRIRPSEKEFDLYDLEATDRDWANKVMKVIRETSGEES